MLYPFVKLLYRNRCLFFSFSTVGINARVLFLYEYSLLGNCIEHLTLCYKIRHHNLAVDILLKAYLMHLLGNLIEYFQIGFLSLLPSLIDCLHLILNFIVINLSALIGIDDDFLQRDVVGIHIVLDRLVQDKIVIRIQFFRTSFGSRDGSRRSFSFSFFILDITPTIPFSSGIPSRSLML